MKRLSGLMLGISMLVFAAVRPAMAEHCGGPISEDEALTAEDARYAAQMSDDFDAMQKLFGDDLIYIHSTAHVDNKASYIDSMKSGTVKYRVMKRSDVTVRTYGCIAIISGLGNFDVTVKGKEIAVELRFHSIWAKRENGLEFVSWESTRTPSRQ
jgi:hypothetical protein